MPNGHERDAQSGASVDRETPRDSTDLIAAIASVLGHYACQLPMHLQTSPCNLLLIDFGAVCWHDHEIGHDLAEFMEHVQSSFNGGEIINKQPRQV